MNENVLAAGLWSNQFSSVEYKLANLSRCCLQPTTLPAYLYQARGRILLTLDIRQN